MLIVSSAIVHLGHLTIGLSAGPHCPRMGGKSLLVELILCVAGLGVNA